MDEDILNLCCVGISNHMEEHLLPSFMVINGINISSIVSRDPGKLSRLKTSYGAAGFNDWKEAIKVSKPDGVVVAGPPEFNTCVVDYCIKHAVPVFSEKPCGTSFFAVNELLSHAQSKDAIVHVGYNYRKSTPFENILKLSERFGRIRHLDIEFNANKPKVCMWGLTSTIESFLLAVAIHPIELVFEICKNPLYVHSNVIELNNEKFKFFLNVSDEENSVRIASGNNSQALEVRFRALYESGDVAQTHLEAPQKISIIPTQPTSGVRNGMEKLTEISTQSRAIERDRYSQGYEAQMRDFLAAVQNHEPSFNDLITSSKAHKLVEQILRKQNQNV